MSSLVNLDPGKQAPEIVNAIVETCNKQKK